MTPSWPSAPNMNTTTGHNNVFIGHKAGSYNTAVGYKALYKNYTYIINKCKCCDRDIGSPSGDRGLCSSCEEDIPDYIPEEQYLTYMKELWRKK